MKNRILFLVFLVWVSCIKSNETVNPDFKKYLLEVQRFCLVESDDACFVLQTSNEGINLIESYGIVSGTLKNVELSCDDSECNVKTQKGYQIMKLKRNIDNTILMSEIWVVQYGGVDDYLSFVRGKNFKAVKLPQ